MEGNSKLIEFDWVVEESQVPQEIDGIIAAGGTTKHSGVPYKPKPDELDDYADASFEPMILISVTVATTYLLTQILRLWRDLKYQGGQIVDTRKDKLHIRRVSSLDRGTLVIISDSGTSVFRPEQESEGLALLEKILGRT